MNMLFFQINKDDLISNSLCDDCFLKCNQWKTFKDQCEYSEQELRELSIKQVKSAINEIEFLDLGLEIKEEESDQENGFDNSFIPEIENSSSEDEKPLTEHIKRDRTSSSEDDKPLAERVGDQPFISSMCEVKVEEIQADKAKQIREPLKMLIEEHKYNSKDSFYISQTPTSKLENKNVKTGAKKYIMVKNHNGRWDKDDIEYKYTPGKSKKIIAYKCKTCNQAFRHLNIYELHFMTVHMNKEAIHCRICNEQYSRKLFLIQHLTKRHLVDIKTPTYKCDECDIGFEKEILLTRHSKLHQRFYCDKCNKSFNRKFSLKVR